jgi:hypothetical protein
MIECGARLQQHHGEHGALDVLRNGLKDSGCSCRLAFFKPPSA